MERAEATAPRADAARASPPASAAEAAARAAAPAAGPTGRRAPRVSATRVPGGMGTRTRRRVTKGRRVRPADPSGAGPAGSALPGRPTDPRVIDRGGVDLGPAAGRGR